MPPCRRCSRSPPCRSCGSSRKEQIHFLEISFGSLNEVMCQIEIANELGIQTFLANFLKLLLCHHKLFYF
ncbi:MAG: four helix bundle protein [Spirochaetaceae bacterium]|nr:four helix bundle protein [Spirochaetaceae bacterium]